MEKLKSTSENIAVVGAGNVGLPTSAILAQIATANRYEAFKAALVDFDTVSVKDVCKGFGANRVGKYKVEAIVEFIKEQYGTKAAGFFRPYVAAAQSVPGLLQESDVVFNGTDSKLDAAIVSEEARNALEIRMSTGMFGQVAVHTVEVMPPGFALGQNSYDTAAWADTSRRHCLFGSTINSAAGAAQPFGALAASLAVNAWMDSRQRPPERPYMIKIHGGEIRQYLAPAKSPPLMRRATPLDFSYDLELGDLWKVLFRLLGISIRDFRIGFATPLVTRFCPACGEDSLYLGFERFPADGKCPDCGEPAICGDTIREAMPSDLKPFANRSLRQLQAPAGLRFCVWLRDGEQQEFRLPFRPEDMPPSTARKKPTGLERMYREITDCLKGELRYEEEPSVW